MNNSSDKTTDTTPQNSDKVIYYKGPVKMMNIVWPPASSSFSVPTGKPAAKKEAGCHKAFADSLH